MKHERGPRPERGMTDEEARAYGTLPPEGWRPPALPGPARTLHGAARTALGAAALGGQLVAWRGGGGRPEQEAYDALRRVAWRTLRVLGIRLEVLGEPPGHGVVLMWNQESHLDHLLLPAAIPRPVRTLYNVELGRFPVYGEYLRRTGNYLVDRFDEAQWRASIARAASDVASGRVTLLLSPEGTRSWDGELLSMKRGGFLIAVRAQAPIVPIVLVGGHRRLPRTSALVRPGAARAVFARPIPTAGATDDDIPALMDAVRRSFSEAKARYAPR